MFNTEKKVLFTLDSEEYGKISFTGFNKIRFNKIKANIDIPENIPRKKLAFEILKGLICNINKKEYDNIENLIELDEELDPSHFSSNQLKDFSKELIEKDKNLRYLLVTYIPTEDYDDFIINDPDVNPSDKDIMKEAYRINLNETRYYLKRDYNNAASIDRIYNIMLKTSYQYLVKDFTQLLFICYIRLEDYFETDIFQKDEIKSSDDLIIKNKGDNAMTETKQENELKEIEILKSRNKYYEKEIKKLNVVNFFSILLSLIAVVLAIILITTSPNEEIENKLSNQLTTIDSLVEDVKNLNNELANPNSKLNSKIELLTKNIEELKTDFNLQTKSINERLETIEGNHDRLENKFNHFVLPFESLEWFTDLIKKFSEEK